MKLKHENREARAHGIPKWLKQHPARHGVSVGEIMQTHRKYPSALLDNWRDRNGGVRPVGIDRWTA